MASWKIAAGGVLLALAITGVAFAQSPPAASPATTPAVPPATPPTASPGANTSLPVPAVGNPAQTSATYGDWSTRCARLPDGGKGLQSCEIVHALVLQGQTQPIAEIAVGSVEKSPDLLLTVVVPVAISLDKTARIEGAPGTRSLADLTWRRCLPGGCYADTPLTADALKILRARTQPANLLFRDGSGHDLTLPFSMRGFDQALDALLKDTSAGK